MKQTKKEPLRAQKASQKVLIVHKIPEAQKTALIHGSRIKVAEQTKQRADERVKTNIIELGSELFQKFFLNLCHLEKMILCFNTQP